MQQRLREKQEKLVRDAETADKLRRLAEERDRRAEAERVEQARQLEQDQAVQLRQQAERAQRERDEAAKTRAMEEAIRARQVPGKAFPVIGAAVKAPAPVKDVLTTAATASPSATITPLKAAVRQRTPRMQRKQSASAQGGCCGPRARITASKQGAVGYTVRAGGKIGRAQGTREEGGRATGDAGAWFG